MISDTNICFLTKLTKDFTWRLNKLRLTAPDLFCHLFSVRGHRKVVQAAHTSLTAKLLIYDGTRWGIHSLNRHWAGGSPPLVYPRIMKGEKKEQTPPQKLEAGHKTDVGIFWNKLWNQRHKLFKQDKFIYIWIKMGEKV